MVTPVLADGAGGFNLNDRSHAIGNHPDNASNGRDIISDRGSDWRSIIHTWWDDSGEALRYYNRTPFFHADFYQTIPFQPLTGWRFALYDSAAKLAIKLLEESTLCRSRVAGETGVDPTRRLKELVANKKFGYGGPNTTGYAETESYKLPFMHRQPTGRITLYDHFFVASPDINDRALTILHELRHLIKAEWHDGIGATSPVFDKDISGACF